MMKQIYGSWAEPLPHREDDEASFGGELPDDLFIQEAIITEDIKPPGN